MRFYDGHPESTWEDGFKYIYESFGYDRYPGNCHIIPNICVMILALLYGEGDFDRTLAIGCMCGWDTDCNVGNISTIMGVRGGLDAINYRKFREPVNDFLACSSVIGSLNNMDIPYGRSISQSSPMRFPEKHRPSRGRTSLTTILMPAILNFPDPRMPCM